jgi:hypothetical protein
VSLKTKLRRSLNTGDWFITCPLPSTAASWRRFSNSGSTLPDPKRNSTLPSVALPHDTATSPRKLISEGEASAVGAPQLPQCGICKFPSFDCTARTIRAVSRAC